MGRHQDAALRLIPIQEALFLHFTLGTQHIMHFNLFMTDPHRFSRMNSAAKSHLHSLTHTNVALHETNVMQHEKHQK